MSVGQLEPRAGFLSGQRAPDFALPNADGKLGRFYDRFTGKLVVLFFCPTTTAVGARNDLQGFNARAGAFDAADTTIVVVTRDSAAANAALEVPHGIDFTVFSDPAGAITRGYGADGASSVATPHESECTTYLLDRNQRVLATQFGGSGHAAWALERLRTEAPSLSPARQVTHQAPVLLLPNVVDDVLCARAIEAWRADHEEGAMRLRTAASSTAAAGASTEVVNHRVKKRMDHRPGEALNRDLAEAVLGRIEPELLKAFQFQIVAAERFCIAAYNANRGDYFKPHRDNTTTQTERRRFAITVHLNDDYDGGGVKFPEFADDVYTTTTGGVLVFSCSLMHEALPVTKGTRLVALSFLFGPGDVPGRPPGPPA